MSVLAVDNDTCTADNGKSLDVVKPKCDGKSSCEVMFIIEISMIYSIYRYLLLLFTFSLTRRTLPKFLKSYENLRDSGYRSPLIGQ